MLMSYDPLFKVRSARNAMLKGTNKAWVVGQRVTVDESKICYMGHAVEHVQYGVWYKPAKQIKHEIKVYAMCCAVSGIMIAWNDYTGSYRKVLSIPPSRIVPAYRQASRHP